MEVWLQARRLEAQGVGPALVPEDECELARGAQPVGVSRPERRARSLLLERAQQVLVEEAVLATWLR